MLTFEQKETMAGLLILFTFVAILGIISKLFRNELRELRRWAANDIARRFGVPPPPYTAEEQEMHRLESQSRFNFRWGRNRRLSSDLSDAEAAV